MNPHPSLSILMLSCVLITPACATTYGVQGGLRATTNGEFALVTGVSYGTGPGSNRQEQQEGADRFVAQDSYLFTSLPRTEVGAGVNLRTWRPELFLWTGLQLGGLGELEPEAMVWSGELGFHLIFSWDQQWGSSTKFGPSLGVGVGKVRVVEIDSKGYSFSTPMLYAKTTLFFGQGDLWEVGVEGGARYLRTSVSELYLSGEPEAVSRNNASRAE